MTLNNYYLLSIILLLRIINGSTRRINLSPYAFWDQNGTTVAGWANGTNGSSPSQLSRPLDLSITADDVLYISDFDNHRIVVLPLKAVGDKFIIDPVSGSNSSLFHEPSGLSTTNTSLYVVDRSNHQVRKLSLNGTNATTVSGLSGFNWAFYLYVDDNTNIYFSDTNDHRVLLFYHNSTNGIIVAGNGTAGSNNNQLNLPYGVFVNDHETIYIADTYNHRIMKWFSGASSGIRVAGDGTLGSSSTQLDHPTQILVDTNEYMYISDDENHRIIRWAPNSTFGVCIAACTQTTGTASTQLYQPHSLAFDSDGSLYVGDHQNHRVQKFQIFNYHTISYKEPEVSKCATWYKNATTFLNINTVNRILVGIFVDMNDTAAETFTNRTQIVVRNGKNTNSANVSIALVNLYNLFITIKGDIYVDNGAFYHRLLKWSLDPTFSNTFMPHLHSCTSLFIDINDSIYCSIDREHIVIKVLLNDTSDEEIFTIGNGTNGSTPDLLYSPNGIFVDSELHLYVADTGNHRVQRFESGSNNGTTVAGNRALGNEGLHFPTGVVVDRNGYLFIADCGNHRIIRSEPNGFRCIVGCSKEAGTASKQLHHPRALWFDSASNMFVLDQINHRIQKFRLQTRRSRRSPCSVPLTCWNPRRIGFYCNFSIEICDLCHPCQNDGTCLNSDDNQNYTCLCASGFSGTNCELDHRSCTPSPCWNNGTCNETSDKGFNCTCALGWEGRHCERKKNYCFNITCENKGVCRSSLGSASCECLDGYSGQYCETTTTRLVILKAASKSFASVAILAMTSVVTFVIVMDILKYYFGIDPVEEERERMRREKRAKKRRPVIQRFVYVNAPVVRAGSTHSDST